MRVLLCGEGPTDYGQRNYESEQWVDGPVQIFIRKIYDGEIEIESIEKKSVLGLTLGRQFQGRNLSGHGGKALKLAILAREKRKDVAACYVDADKSSGESGSDPVRCKRRFEEVYQEIQRGFEPMAGQVKGLAVVPLKMIESWLLSDEQAFVVTFHEAIPKNSTRLTHPELIWGTESDPQSNHPKCYLRRVLSQYGYEIEGNLELFCSLAENSRVEILRSKCSISFEKFYNDMQGIG
ncbi:MAG TPA: hypothetical protein DDW65_19550 [Firmicutes bacterium]|jgi:hypothetical protein|nr:hypothetical protein [Bacillota bacterium]